jgi:NADH:ubiquinone oxidoreductase subunit 3 (subunit A)
MNYIIAPLDSLVTIYPAIMGLKPWAFLLVVFLVFVVVLYVLTVILDSRKRNQNVKKTTMPDGKTRKTNAVFITEGRGAYEELCNVWMNEAEVKEQGKKVKTVGTVDAPKVASQRIPKYYLVAEYMFQIRWPKNAKKSQQTEIMQVFYRENYSLPAFSFNELSGEERTAMTAILTSISSDQNVANAVVTEIQQKFDTFTKAINKLKNLNMILYIVFAIAVVSLFILVYTFQDHSILMKLKLLVP